LDISFTLHWGKINFILNPALVQKMYGDNVAKWKECRNQLLSEKSKRVFTNAFMVQCGLAD
jgi:hypothetical protein